MAFEPKKITKDHILAGVSKIQTEKPELKPSTRWDVVIDGDRYPPKEIMRYAHQEMNGERIWEYGGGDATNKWLSTHGFEIIDKSNPHDPVKDLIQRYKDHIRNSKLREELYKWRLIKTFNGRPNTNAKDFSEEIRSIDFSNMLYEMAGAVIKHVAKDSPEKLRNAFKHLFNEGIELAERITYFHEETLRIYREVDPTSTYSHHQDERTMATYLAYHDSSKYAFFKDSFYQKYCKLIGVKPRKKGEKLVHYLSLLDDFIENYILEDTELLDLKNKFLTTDCYKDGNHKILAQDILYSTLDLQKGLGRSYWRVGTSDGSSNYWETMMHNNYISIGWQEIGDLNEHDIQDKKDILKLLNNQGYYKSDKKVGSRKAGEILVFYSEIKEGDIILAQDGSKVLGIGEVTGEYGYDSSQPFSHFKRVKWKVHNPDLKNSEGLRTTVYKITQPDTIHQVDLLLSQHLNEVRMTKELNQILYGPPGTGKTYSTLNKALDICGVNIEGLERQEVKAKFENLVDSGQVVFTTFHQSMTYEDFVEGIKPIEPEKEGDPVIYRVEEGIFRRICIEAAFSLAKEDESASTENVLDFSLAYDQFIQELSEKLSSEDQVELMTKNGGKVIVDGISSQGNISVKHIGGTRTYTISKSRLTKLQSGIENLDDVSNINDEFRAIIGGSNSSAYWAVLKAIRSKQQPAGTRKDLRKYSWDDKVQVVKSLKKEDYKDKTGEPYVLIIDEINRGNVSQIFGELITLIEPDKRLGNPEAIQVQLPYSKDWFGVPPNVYIIGTMNTADRSVEALDTALRRRFSFFEMAPDTDLINTEGRLENGVIEGIHLSNVLELMNKRIEKLLDKDHMIGHSYFLSVKDLDSLKSAFQNRVIPLLQEYFFGDYGKIGLVIGEAFFERDKNVIEETFFAPFEDYDSSPLIERKIYHLKNVFDMKDSEFIEALNFLQHKNS